MNAKKGFYGFCNTLFGGFCNTSRLNRGTRAKTHIITSSSFINKYFIGGIGG